MTQFATIRDLGRIGPASGFEAVSPIPPIDLKSYPTHRIRQGE